LYRCSGLHGICGNNDREARKSAEQGQVLNGVMRGAILANGDAPVGGHDLDVEFGLRQTQPQLIKATTGDEYGEAAHKDGLSRGSQTGSYADHVLFLQAAVNKAARELARKEIGHRGRREIGI
jgi:hypothetical protein